MTEGSPEWVADENLRSRAEHSEMSDYLERDIEITEGLEEVYDKFREGALALENFYETKGLGQDARAINEIIQKVLERVDELHIRKSDTRAHLDAGQYRGQQFVAKNLDTLTTQAKAEAEAAGHTIDGPLGVPAPEQSGDTPESVQK